MAHMSLLSRIGTAAAEQTAQQVIELFEQRFPSQISGYYLVGSYAVGEAITTSDVDIVALFAGTLNDADRERFAETLEQCRRESPLPIDMTPISEERLRYVGGVWFQTASRLLYGKDVRDTIPRKLVADHTRDTMHAVVALLARVRGNPEQLGVPLDYPDPEGEFFGYDRRQMRLADGTTCASTKNVVLNVIGAANALTLLAASQYLGSGKTSEIPVHYRAWVGGEWAGLVTELYEYGRNRWAYRVPDAPTDRRHLRELCARALGFENYFLERYRTFLLAERESGDAARREIAERRLAQLIQKTSTDFADYAASRPA
jgi:hypothetical protein